MTILDPKEIRRLSKKIEAQKRRSKWLLTKSGQAYLERHRTRLVRKTIWLLRKPDGSQRRLVHTEVTE